MSRRMLLAALLVVAFAATATAAVLHDLTGRWQLAVVTDNGTGYPILELKQEGDRVTGSYTSNAMGARTISGRVYGDTLSFTLSPSGAGEGMVLTYTARIVTADSLNGYVDFAGQGGARFTGARQR
ncbi:MAG TPA: hypothetical protein PK788_03325 [Gemmatimonadaceae bacterium]|nr:hypothetical protein [Gemmatimonadaceae bacterium]HRQ78679.1 hypothetical protein [Gemmatimonadaceae bacterium]